MKLSRLNEERRRKWCRGWCNSIKTLDLWFKEQKIRYKDRVDQNEASAEGSAHFTPVLIRFGFKVNATRRYTAHDSPHHPQPGLLQEKSGSGFQRSPLWASTDPELCSQTSLLHATPEAHHPDPRSPPTGCVSAAVQFTALRNASLVIRRGQRLEQVSKYWLVWRYKEPTGMINFSYNRVNGL